MYLTEQSGYGVCDSHPHQPETLKSRDPWLLALLDRVLAGQELTAEQGLDLLTRREPADVAAIQGAADRLRSAQVGETVTYVVNRNINFTNICEQHCGFCAFRRDPAEPGAYWLTETTILAKAAEAVSQGATEICMQGGLNPEARLNDRALDYYLRLVSALKDQFPDLHLHAFSPQEIQFIARQDGLSYETVLRELQAAGLGSLPGTAAEVLDDAVRRLICPEKLDSATWLEIVATAHRLGLPTTSTMLSGHVETPAQQIHHLDRLRDLQRRSLDRISTGEQPALGRITEFILLPFVGQDAPAPLRRRVGRDQPVLADALLLTAVARLYLGQVIPNHQPSWVKLGLDGAAIALAWGCNDLGGTLMEEHITSMAGAQGGTCQTVADLRRAIAQVDRPAQQRDTLYKPIGKGP